MREPGPLLASGRDADIFEYSRHLVLRRSRAGRSMAHEARIMQYLRDRGYPVPAVEDISADGLDLVMERVEGPSMVQVLSRRPWTVLRQAQILADLHLQLHELSGPDFLAPGLIGQGDRIIHMDLHPLNVLIGPSGPVVIDWTNASVGDPAVDVGLAWVLLAAGQIPGNRVAAYVLGLGRTLLVNGFVSRFDRPSVASQLREIVSWKVQDPNMSQLEIANMWRLVQHEERKLGL
jgi:aminoglycoside phosphotransferase (APT) family kinase protein